MGAEDEEESVAIPIEDWIDLHTFSPGDIPVLIAGVSAGVSEERVP